MGRATKTYFLTPMARRHLREAKAWSLARWGPEQTREYFNALHEAARDLARHPTSHHSRDELDGGTGLRLYPFREHFLVYEPVGQNRIVIVAVIRQTRDIPEILSRGSYVLRRELNELRKGMRGQK